jgi:hypothetical protein
VFSARRPSAFMDGEGCNRRGEDFPHLKNSSIACFWLIKQK